MGGSCGRCEEHSLHPISAMAADATRELTKTLWAAGIVRDTHVRGQFVQKWQFGFQTRAHQRLCIVLDLSTYASPLSRVEVAAYSGGLVSPDPPPPPSPCCTGYDNVTAKPWSTSEEEWRTGAFRHWSLHHCQLLNGCDCLCDALLFPGQM